MQVQTVSERFIVIRSIDHPEKAAAISFPVTGDLSDYQLRLRVAFETLEGSIYAPE